MAAIIQEQRQCGELGQKIRAAAPTCCGARGWTRRSVSGPIRRGYASEHAPSFVRGLAKSFIWRPLVAELSDAGIVSHLVRVGGDMGEATPARQRMQAAYKTAVPLLSQASAGRQPDEDIHEKTTLVQGLYFS